MANRNPRNLPEGLRDLPIGVIAIRVELFAQAMCEGESQTNAYLKANPEAEKLSKAQLAQRGYQFARSPEVMARVEQIRYEMLQRHRTTADALLSVHVDIINSDLVDAFDDEWKMKKPSELSARMRKAIEKVKITENIMYGGDGQEIIKRTVEYALANKQRSLDAAAKMLGVDQPKKDNNVAGIDDLAEALFRGIERANKKVQERRSEEQLRLKK